MFILKGQVIKFVVTISRYGKLFVYLKVKYMFFITK